MNLNRELPWNSLLRAFVLLGIVFSAPNLHANVYATNLRIDGGTTNVAAAAGDTLTISYLLNEPASLGATIQIRSGTTVVRSFALPAQSQGTLRGLNSFLWDTATYPVPSGTYSIAVLARSSGYTNWTQITSDTADLNTYVYDGRGIAVDANPGSPYYGRVFVSNATGGPNPNSNPGDSLGILKFNADTSDAEEGSASGDTSGHNWLDQGVSPWKLAVSADDYVYVDDLANGGEVYRWDPTISSNSLLHVLRQDNLPQGAALSGPAIVGTGTNTQIWMGDTNQARVFAWSVNGSLVCASNDPGALVVSSTGSNCFAVALDPQRNIYTCAYITIEGDLSPRVFRYPAANPLPTTLPETNADWAVGAGDDTYAGASGVAVDPTGTYLAVSFEGPISSALFSTNGNTKILWATNGALAANLDLGVAMQNDFNHDDTACAWDAVGNVYYIDNYFSRWRAVSPPGTNEATTLALSTVEITGGQPSSTIQITRIIVSGGNVNIDFSAGANDSAAGFVVQASATANGAFATLTTASINQVGSGLFHASFPLSSSTQYFRIARTGVAPPPTAPTFTKIVASGSNLILTFSGNPTDSASAFTLWAAPVVNGTYAQVANPNIVQLSPGVFQATVPFSGAAQFYRIHR